MRIVSPQILVIAVDAVGFLRNTPRVPGIGASCPRTWSIAEAEWRLLQLGSFLQSSQKEWNPTARSRYNKRRSIHQEMRRIGDDRMELINRELTDEEVAAWLDELRRDKTLTAHMQEIRKTNPAVSTRNVVRRRRMPSVTATPRPRQVRWRPPPGRGRRGRGGVRIVRQPPPPPPPPMQQPTIVRQAAYRNGDRMRAAQLRQMREQEALRAAYVRRQGLTHQVDVLEDGYNEEGDGSVSI